ncbi:hypothetical protein QCA50_001750 [Cerrena zonata]|uniref:WDR5-like beta-propeller domain-containing protein n=1 Tax=Cerrena zonata TaxID=2478898 RepID=A0AAW0GU26_9APHY
MDVTQDNHVPRCSTPLPHSLPAVEQPMVQHENSGDVEIQNIGHQSHMNGDSATVDDGSLMPDTGIDMEDAPASDRPSALKEESMVIEDVTPDHRENRSSPARHDDFVIQDVASEPQSTSAPLHVPNTENHTAPPENFMLQHEQDMKVEEKTPTSQNNTPAYQVKFIMSGHTRSVSSLKFSPDGTMLASAAADKLIKIWDCEKGELLDTFEGHTEGISDIAWSSDCEYLASASDDKTIRIWSMETGETAKILKGHTNFVFCVNFNPKCNLLVSGGFDETVRVWDVARAKPLKNLPAHSDPVTAVTFNHDGTLIASCAMDGLIRLWDTESGQCLKTLADDDNPICSHIKFSPNSKYILASTQDSTIRLWNIQSSRCVKTYTGHTNRTYSVFCDFAPSGEYIVSGSEDSRVYIWHLQDRQIAQVLEGHRDAVIAIASNPTRPMIASASVEKDLTIHVWVDTNEP